jgi:hypothetical protein
MLIDGVFRIRITDERLSYDDETLSLYSNFKVVMLTVNCPENNSPVFHNFNVKRK